MADDLVDSDDDVAPPSKVTSKDEESDEEEEEEEGESDGDSDLGEGGIDLRKNDFDEDEEDSEEEDEASSKRKRGDGVAGKRGSKKARSLLRNLVHMEAEDSDEDESEFSGSR